MADLNDCDSSAHDRQGVLESRCPPPAALVRGTVRSKAGLVTLKSVPHIWMCTRLELFCSSDVRYDESPSVFDAVTSEIVFSAMPELLKENRLANLEAADELALP